MQYAASRSLMIASLLVGLAAAPLANAGEGHGYPQTTSSYSEFSHSSVTRSSEESYGGAWSEEEASQYGEAHGGHHWPREEAERYRAEKDGDGRYARERYEDHYGRDRGDHDRYDHDRYGYGYGHRVIERDVVDDGGVGYLPVTFFADAGGVGPYGDFGGGGGGGGFVYAAGSGFAGARASASASASASVSIVGGFRGGFHGGGFHHGGPPSHGGGHGCGCK